MTALAADFTLEAPPRHRCGHRQTITLAGVELEARCWSPADASGYCPPHCDEDAIRQTLNTVYARVTDLMGADVPEYPAQPHPGVTYLCPARTSALFACRRELPCTSHDVPNPIAAHVIYGSVLAHMPDRRRPIRFEAP